ncbi:hypothetical protein D9M71_645260 [compost metagenome]
MVNSLASAATSGVSFFWLWSITQRSVKTWATSIWVRISASLKRVFWKAATGRSKALRSFT